MYLRLVLVLQVILYVTHLVVSGEQVFHVDPSALFYPVKMDGIDSELPGLAPSLYTTGWSLYWMKYCTWPISW